MNILSRMPKKTKKPVPRPILERKIRALGGFEKAARHAASADIEVSSSFLYHLARGTRNPSDPLARDLARALGLPVKDVA